MEQIEGSIQASDIVANRPSWSAAEMDLGKLPVDIARMIVTRHTLHECISGGWVMTVRDPEISRVASWAAGWGRAPVAKVVIGHFPTIADVDRLVQRIKAAGKDVRQSRADDQAVQIGRFLGECVRPGAGKSAQCSNVYQHYTAWCALRLENPLGEKVFMTVIQALGYAPTGNRTKSFADIILVWPEQDDAEPRYVQLKRTKGWTMPDGAVKVDRSTRWGNPFKVVPVPEQGKLLGSDECTTTASAVKLFAAMLRGGNHEKWGYPSPAVIRKHLAGKDLACWCKPGDPCHAMVLLDVANSTGPVEDVLSAWTE